MPDQPAPRDETDRARPARTSDLAGAGTFRGGRVASRLSIRPGVEGDLSSPLTLHLTGELDVDTAAGLRESLAVLAGRFEGGALVLDLSGVTFCDPASLYTLLGIRQALPLAGVEVSFSHASAVTLAAADRVGLVERLNL